VLAFIRTSRYTVARPEVLGLPVTTGQTVRVVERGREIFRDAVLAGDEDRCRQAVFDLYLAEHRITAICDRVISAAFSEIGQRWASGQAEVYEERRACEITRRVLFELRSALTQPDDSAPAAIGGTPEGDFYELPTTMVELALLDAGWNARSLGSSLPESTLRAAIQTVRPTLFWLSVSHVADPTRFLRDYESIYRTAADAGVAVVVGGRELTEDLRQAMQYAAHCDNLQHLDAFAATVYRSREPEPPTCYATATHPE
jgi:methanogenic corrinoid protein MtbC1